MGSGPPLLGESGPCVTVVFDTKPRHVGVELGGAIGIPLFLCRTLSITFYSFGLVEAILAVWPARWGEIPSAAPQIMAAAIIIIITLISAPAICSDRRL